MRTHMRLMSRKSLWLAGGICALLWSWSAAEDAPAPADSSSDTAAPAPEPGPEPRKFKLAFKFQPGQVVRYEVSHETEITTHYSEATELARNQSQTRRSYKVAAVTPEGAGDLELSIDWVRMVAEFDNGVEKSKPIEFQSDDPLLHPPKFKHILASVGQPQAVIRFSASGRPEKVDRTKAGRPGTTPLSAVPGTDTSPESYLITLSEQPIGVGESWKESYDVVARNEENLPVRITMLRRFKLAEVAAGLATIEFRTSILTPVQDPAISAQLIQRETAGKIVFDVEQGLIVSRAVGVDRTVVNPFGPRSSMRASSAYREKLLPPAATAARSDAAANTASQR